MKKREIIPVEAKPIAQPAWEEAVDNVERVFKNGRNEHTVRSDLKSLELFGKFLGVDSFKDLCLRFIGVGQGKANMAALRFRDWLVAEKKAPSTVNRRLGALGKLVELFKFNGAIPWDLDVQYVPVETYRDTSGPGTEVFAARLASLVGKTDPMSVRDRTILILLHDGVIRRGELVSIDLEHVDLQKHLLWVKAKKRTARVDIPMGKEMEEAVEEWIRVRGNDPGPLFTNFDPAGKGEGRLSGRSVARVTHRYGVGHPHGIRHLGITELAEALNGNILEVMKHARQRDPKTTMIYIDNLKKRSADSANILAGYRKTKPAEPQKTPPDPGSGGEKRASGRAPKKG